MAATSALSVAANFDYCVAPQTSSYQDAVEFCGNRSMVLVMPKTVQENELANGACGESKACWLGLREGSKEGDWSWDDGAPLDYSNWASNDMRNHEANEQHAAFFVKGAGGGIIECCHKWYDVLEGRGLYVAVCQVEAGTVDAGSCTDGRFVTNAEAQSKVHGTSNARQYVLQPLILFVGSLFAFA